MKKLFFTAIVLLLNVTFHSAQAQDCNAPAGPNVNWSGCDKFLLYLPGVDLSFANLSGTELSGTRLMRANLNSANLTNAYLNGADLNRANLTNASLTGADLYFANLTNANLTGVLSGGIIGTPSALPVGWALVNGYLIGPGANLTNANLTGANLTGVVSGGIIGTPSALPVGWALVNGYLVGPPLTVTFNANGGTTSVPATKLVTYNANYGTLATTSRSCYTFKGWFTASSGGTEITSSSTVAINSDQTLYAQWTANQPSTAPTSINSTAATATSGTNFTLSVNGGSLGTDASWKWYTSSCGGTLIGTGASISVSQTANTTYFVRAESACSSTVCASLTVPVITPCTALRVSNTNNDGPGSLRYAIDCANSGDEITFDHSIDGQPIVLSSTIFISKALKITGNGAANTIIDGNNSILVFRITHEGSNELKGLTVRNGDGGIFCGYMNLSIVDCEISNNNYGNNFSGIRCTFGSLSLVGSTVSGNNVGVNAYGTSLIITNSTICNNKGQITGGLYLSSASIVITNSTISNNESEFYAGGLYLESSSSVFKNSIIAGNLSLYGAPDIEISSSTIDPMSSYNLIGSNNYGIFPSGNGNLLGGNGNPLLNPGLRPLANNGGPTKTMALLCSSPAIDAGNPNDNSADQRNQAVYNSRRDIGAFEYLPQPVVIVAPTSINSTAATATSGTNFTLSVNGGSLGTDATWKWYTASCGGTLIGTGTSISVSQTVNTIYFVRAEGNCNSTSCASLAINMAAATCGDGRYAEQMVSFHQQKAINGTAVVSGRSQSSKALCTPQNNNTENFVSLGFGGDITLKFGKAIRNGAGNDIRVYETTFGNLSCTAYPEKAQVFASQDGCRFVYLGEICQDGTVDLGALTWAQYVRLVDVSSKTAVYQSSGTPDGYDVDAVEGLNGFEINPVLDPIAGGATGADYLPGQCRGGANIPVERSNKNNALGIPQGTDRVNFVSLGFGGSITLRFKYAVENNPTGLDLQVVETSYGNPSCNSYPEKARFEGSLDGATWTDLGELCQDGKLEMGTLPYLHLLRITDVSEKAKFSPSADGFDVDGVVAINQCTSGNTREAVEIVDDIQTADELEIAGLLELYPNPATESATFSFSSQNESAYGLKIVNALGQMVYITEGKATEGANTIELNLENLSKGLYIVQLVQNNGIKQLNLIKK